MAAGLDPTIIVGGRMREVGTARLGHGEYLVAEADESDGAFLVYSPHAAIVTNVEADHLDIWGTEEAYRAAFLAFLDRIDGSLLDPDIAACPFAYYTQLREKAPVYRMPETGFYVISRYEALKEVLSDPETYWNDILIEQLAGDFDPAPGKSWGGPGPISPRVLTVLAVEGHLVRWAGPDIGGAR